MRRLNKPALWTASLAILMVGIALVSAVIPFRQIVDQQRRVEAATAELAMLETENELLAAEIDALSTPQEIERLARERLGYVMPGDVPYVVLEPPADDVSPTTTAPPVTLPTEEPWYRDLWEFFTGADLVES